MGLLNSIKILATSQAFDWETIVKWVSIVVSILLAVLGFGFNTLLQRKNNSIHIITEKRVERREKTHELVAEILKLSDIYYLDNIAKRAADKKRETIEKLCEDVAFLRAIYTYTCVQDYDMCTAAKELEVTVIDYLKFEKGDREEVVKKRERFEQLADVYIQTDWTRIKIETTGKSYKSKKGKKFDDLYKENIGKYSIVGKKE